MLAAAYLNVCRRFLRLLFYDNAAGRFPLNKRGSYGKHARGSGMVFYSVYKRSHRFRAQKFFGYGKGGNRGGKRNGFRNVVKSDYKRVLRNI